MLEMPSLPHLLMVLVIFVLLFGAKRVPEIAGSMGKGIKEFKRNIREATDESPSENYSANSGRHSGGVPASAGSDQEPPREPKRLLADRQ